MRKSYDELTITDDFMFCKVLEHDVELCRELVELIMDRKIEIVSSVRRQHPVEITPDGKGIRLDVRMEGDHTIYSLEMQNGHRKELPRRARYYQGLTDLDLMDRGAKYWNLKDTVLVFICTMDPFQLGYARYTVKNMIEEAPEYEYNDGTRLVFLSSLPGLKGEMSKELRGFLDYVNGEMPKTDFARKLDAAVQRAKSQKDWRGEYMLWEEKLEESREEGYREGYNKGGEARQVNLIRTMSSKGKGVKEICELTDLSPDYVAGLLSSPEDADTH